MNPKKRQGVRAMLRQRIWSLCGAVNEGIVAARHVSVACIRVDVIAIHCRRRTRPRSLPGQHFLHYFSEEVPRGERGIRTCREHSFPEVD